MLNSISEVHVYDSCATIPDNSASGTYCVDPEASGAPFHVWCEMDIDGGHWTLVYSYEVSDQNAVNPVPNWYTTRTVQPISTTTPITDDQLGAMEFSQWQTFGDVVLMKSAQALTLTCQPFVGNIVRYLPGRLDCRILDQQESLGCTVFSLPFQFRVRGCGPYISKLGVPHPEIYYWDGCTHRDYPDHWPCQAGNVTPEVTHIRGWIYVRNYY